MTGKKYIIPNVFTALNIFCGFLAIINVAEGKIATAGWLVVFAAIFDALDGKVARITKTYSNFGVEFDSLADVVSFGAAPAILLYKAHYYSLGTLGLLLSFMPLLFGGIRLARFNIQLEGFDKEKFVGLPIPMAAIALCTFVIFNYELSQGLRFARLLTPLVIFLSLLMVSTIEYETLPKISFKEDRKNSVKLLLIIICAMFVGLFPKEIFFLIMTYILFGVFRWVFYLFKGEEEIDVPISDQLGNNIDSS
ncbi:MAG: CDP-diacylglycerol--serine O-phosphatidyltransferase [candidate division KSB1 bacterium]|nr:CDP-diacylglycerol--serine O-phosphatidyltransferase [candidate division KSB1 bacterium]